jgi:hypothetical protein
MNVIDWMNQLLVHKKPWDSFTESEQKSFNSYIINRWLSMDKDFIEIVNYFQRYAVGTLEQREVYTFYKDVLPKGKRFNRYIKSKLDKKYDEELITTMCIYFECSKLQVKENLQLISKEELKSILSMYGLDNKKIRKLIK